MAIATATEERRTQERRKRAAEQRVLPQETPPLKQPGAQEEEEEQQQRPASRQLSAPVSSAAHEAVALGRASGAVGAVSESSAPSPGQPGSPFNATTRERPDRTPSVPARILIDASEIPGRGVAEGTTVSEATKEGLASGFTNGVGASLGAGSALGALAQVGEAAESSLSQPAGLDKRMERFPELRDVEVPTGNAARFPELVEDDKRPAVQPQATQDEGYER